MSMNDATQILGIADFQRRASVALTRTAIAVANETANEVQTLSVSGLPTGGSFTLASLPGNQVIVQNGTTANAAATVTGLSSTVGLFVGMSVTGQGVAAGATIASITSLTAITLSANSTASATVPLTFSGTPLAQVAFNASAADVQATLQALSNIGVGNVICTGGPLPNTAIVITFCNTLGNNPQKLLTIGTNSLTGGVAPAPSVARTTAGLGKALHTARQALASKVLANVNQYVGVMGLGITDNATIQTDYAPPSYQLAVAENTVDNDLAFQVSAIWNAYI